MEELAINGGSPGFPEGPPGWPPPDEDVQAVLVQLAADGSWGRYHGPHCDALIESISQYQQLEHVRLYASGTIAVEAALRAAGVEQGDRVLLAGYDFPGNFRAIEAIGARPVLVDPSLATWSLDAGSIELSQEYHPKAVIVSHLHGGLAPMPTIRSAADAHGVVIIEDACQVPGAVIGGKPAGSWGHVGVWSFGGSKLLTSGRGGAIFTDDPIIAQRAKLFSERGNDAFPLSEMQAAILLPQLEKLDPRTAQRAKAASILIATIESLGMLRSVEITEDRHAFYKLALRVDSNQTSPNLRENLSRAARAEGLALDAGFRGFARRGAGRCDQISDLSVSKQLASGTLVLHHPLLLADATTIDRASDVFRKLMKLVNR